jgi:hypothetical protein
VSNNATYPLIPGDTWEYTDTDRENAKVLWRIDAVNGQFVDMTKMSGEKKGFKAEKYAAPKIRAPKWRWVDGEADPSVTFPCPECDRMRPIHDGDFICAECRESRDED